MVALSCISGSRDALVFTFGVASDEKELKEAQDLLIQQKPLVYSYLVDEAQDEMIAENAAMAVVYSGEGKENPQIHTDFISFHKMLRLVLDSSSNGYSGEAGYALEFNENLAFSVPEEGSNMWIDSWFIPKTCKNQENVEKFLDFLCREDIARELKRLCTMSLLLVNGRMVHCLFIRKLTIVLVDVGKCGEIP